MTLLIVSAVIVIAPALEAPRVKAELSVMLALVAGPTIVKVPVKALAALVNDTNCPRR